VKPGKVSIDAVASLSLPILQRDSRWPSCHSARILCAAPSPGHRAWLEATKYFGRNAQHCERVHAMIVEVDRETAR